MIAKESAKEKAKNRLAQIPPIAKPVKLAAGQPRELTYQYHVMAMRQ